MSIPDNAFHAACETWHEHMHPNTPYHPGEDGSGLMARALEAAAPYIEAAAIRREAVSTSDWGQRVYLLHRADKLDEKAKIDRWRREKGATP